MTLRMVSTVGLAAALAGSLAACGSGDAPATADGADAQGDIRGGTISDAMLPLDQLKSESPPMRPAPGESGEAAAAGDDEATEGEAEASEAEPGEGPGEVAVEADEAE